MYMVCDRKRGERKAEIESKRHSEKKRQRQREKRDRDIGREQEIERCRFFAGNALLYRLIRNKNDKRV